MKKITAELADNLTLDTHSLVNTRGLVQGTSGSGKSYTLRKIIETTYGQVQHIILDVEGDFASLREKFDYVLAGKNGDIPASVKTAGLLARKVLQLKTNLIVDLYELKMHERIQFVKLFLESMIDAPKELWQPVLILIDEAHIFAPEKGNAESMSAVIDICTRGRKRGYGTILATQRLSKLHKDAAAECGNKLIGRTNLDIDVKRAADELGLNSKDAQNLRTLKPGEFFAFGPAISNEIVKVKIGKTVTSHPVAGTRGMSGNTPAASSKVKQALKELADLPKELEVELKTTADLKARINQLTQELKLKPAPAVDQSKIDQAIERGVSQAKVILEKEFKLKLKSIKDELSEVLNKVVTSDIPTPKVSGVIQPQQHVIKHTPPTRQMQKAKEVPTRDGGNDAQLGACEKKILGFLASQPGKSFSKVQVGAMTGYAHSSGGFNNALSKLGQSGYITRSNAMISLNSDADVSEFLSGVPHTLQNWIDKLDKCQKAIYQFLLDNPSDSFDKSEVADHTGYAHSSGGFNNAISRLNTLGLIQRNSGRLQINEDLLGI